jgi:peroxiredoxin
MRTSIAVFVGAALGVFAALGLGLAVYSLVPGEPPPTAPTSPSPVVVVGTAEPAPIPTGTAQSPAASAVPAPTASRSPAPFPLIGRAAPALTAPRLDGTTLDLATYRGKPVWLVFTGTYCPSCRDEYPLMNGLAVRYAEAGLIVLAVHVKEDAATVRPFVDDLNIVFPVALDADGSRAASWDAIALPVHYWVDAEGVVREAALGGLGPDQMARSLGTILPGVTIAE